ncbi:MAG: hypothetical protein E7316_02740 [Clostridiales bacterium]|nr:hypothetical protein [Clostridiales bacterium]
MKKLFAMLLALVMMTLPVLGLAASPSEMMEEATNAGRPVSGKVTLDFGSYPGLDESVATIINDVVDALGFTYAQQEDQVDFALTLSGADVLTLSTATEGEDTYIKSNLLGEDVVAFNAEEGEIALNYLLALAEDAGMFSQSDVAEMKQVLAQVIAQASTGTTEAEEIDLTNLIALGTEMASRVTTAEVTQQPKNCDAATTVATVKLTGEDVTAIYKVIFDAVKDMPDFISTLESMNLTVNGQPATAEELIAMLPELADQMGAMVVGEIPVEVYLDAEGEPVYMTMTMTMKGENEEGVEETIHMDGVYSRLTMNETAVHTATIIAKDAAEAGVSISVTAVSNEEKDVVNVDIDSIDSGVAQPVIAVGVIVDKDYGETESSEDMDIEVTITDSDTQQEISLRMVFETEAKKVNDQDVVMEGEMDLYLMGMEDELLSIEFIQETGSAAESIITADAVRLGKMTEEEFNTYMNEDVLTAAQSALIGLVQHLPSSVLSLLLGM